MKALLHQFLSYAQHHHEFPAALGYEPNSKAAGEVVDGFVRGQPAALATVVDVEENDDDDWVVAIEIDGVAVRVCIPQRHHWARERLNDGAPFGLNFVCKGHYV